MRHRMPVGGEAQLFVPRLLLVLGSSDTARQRFSQEWSKVPHHVLLPWAAQMLSLLDAVQGEVLLPALQVGPSQLPNSCYSSRLLRCVANA